MFRSGPMSSLPGIFFHRTAAGVRYQRTHSHDYDSYQLIYQMRICIVVRRGVDFMLKISRQDYDSLEVKIQTAIKQVFSEFLEDLEHKTAGPGETGTAQERQESELPRSTLSGERPPAAAGTKRARPSKRAIEVNRILYGSSACRNTIPREKSLKRIWQKYSEKNTGEVLISGMPVYSRVHHSLKKIFRRGYSPIRIYNNRPSRIYSYRPFRYHGRIILDN